MNSRLFRSLKRKAFESKHKNGEIKLYPEAVLGIFPQAGSQLVPDYLQLIDNNSFQDLETFFQRKNTNGCGYAVGARTRQQQ